MEALISIVDELREVVNTLHSSEIYLPRICVVGAQSSGKSSVLESIVGRNFLPRGCGIVTRRPLILKLVHVSDQGEYKERGRFFKEGELIYDFDKIRERIIHETKKVAGTGRNVSPEPIELTVYSKRVLNLTLIDLPGLVQNVMRDQSATIVGDIRKMVSDFIKDDNTIILAVSQATDDIENSDSLRIAREFDPAGDRTIGVITKVDLMEDGTSCRKTLLNQKYQLKNGFIGVVNRSQEDLDKATPVEEVRLREKKLFEDHRDYSDIAARCGTPYLMKRLNRLLVEHIRKCIPELRQRIQTMLNEKEDELAKFGTDPRESVGTQNAFVLDAINKYIETFQRMLEGRIYGNENKKAKTGAIISRMFIVDFENEIEKLRGVDIYTNEQFLNLMKNHAGCSVPLFTSNTALDMIIFRVIEQFREPAMKLVDDVSSLLFKIHNEVDFVELQRFGMMNDAIRAVVDVCIRSNVNPCKEFINNIIDNEKSFINTKRSDFIGDNFVYTQVEADPRTRPLPEKPVVPDPVGICSVYGSISIAKNLTMHQKEEIVDLKRMCKKYFDLIKKQMLDIIPKAIVKFLVQASSDQLRPSMIRDIFNREDLSTLLDEDQSLSKKRIECSQTVEALRKAQDILNKVRTLNL